MKKNKRSSYYGAEHKPVPEECEAEIRQPNELQLDFDTKRVNLKSLKSDIDRLNTYNNVLQVKRWRSKSGNWHYSIKLSEPVSNTDAIALQASFGSDRIREFVNWERLECNVVDPIMLHRPKNSTIEIVPSLLPA